MHEFVRSVTLEDAKNFVDDAHFGNTMNDICESLATKSDPVQTWQWFGNEDAEGSKSVSWRETSQVKALLEAAKPNPAQPLGYMALGKDRVQGTYVGERALEQSLSSYSDGWELTTTHNPADIPFADPLPKPPIAQNPRQGHNRDQTNSRRQPQVTRSYRAEVGCRVIHVDGREGEITNADLGLFSVLTVDGSTESWPTNSFSVTGPPEL